MLAAQPAAGMMRHLFLLFMGWAAIVGTVFFVLLFVVTMIPGKRPLTDDRMFGGLTFGPKRKGEEDEE